MKYKCIKVALIILLILSMFSIPALATGVDDMYNVGTNWLEAGNATDNIYEGNIKKVSDTIFSILLTLGIIIAVIIATILGVKFMMGTVEEKADIKEKLIPFIIGCVVVFGAFTIWKITISIMQSLNI